MPINERDRIRFHGWLVEHDLDQEVADAILATMPPYDWHELATKSDLAVLDQRIDTRFTLVDGRLDSMDKRFDGMDKRFDGVDRRLDRMDRRLDNLETRMGGMAQEVRAILFTMIGLIVSILLAGGAVLLA